MISSPMAFLLSSVKRRSGCLTGLASGLTCNECSANSLGTPSMYLGDHAKMSRFSRRKSVSSLSYLASNLLPMMATRSGKASSSWTCLVSFEG